MTYSTDYGYDTQVTWMYFGNTPQLNVDPYTPVTPEAADSIEGYSATGSSEISAVTLTGTVRPVTVDYQDTYAFATTYNQHQAGPSPFTYTSPGTGGSVSSKITGFLKVTYELTMPDGSTQQQQGVLIQMGNGDMFFRPSADHMADWNAITSLSSVRIVQAEPLPNTTYVANRSFSPSVHDIAIVCFAAGTLILTPRGEIPVETLVPGDLVITRDNGPRPLRWTGRRTIGAAALRARPKLRPVRIAAGALAPGMPTRDLTVSPQHRVLIRSAIAQRMFGTDEILVPAIHLLEVPGIAQQASDAPVTYCHLLFDAHEVVMSDGAPTESLYPGPEAIRALGPAAIEEIEAIFPGIMTADHPAMTGARPFERGARVRRLVERHGRNARPLVS